jgi:hypothetical protein
MRGCCDKSVEMGNGSAPAGLVSRRTVKHTRVPRVTRGEGDVGKRGPFGGSVGSHGEVGESVDDVERKDVAVGCRDALSATHDDGTIADGVLKEFKLPCRMDGVGGAMVGALSKDNDGAAELSGDFGRGINQGKSAECVIVDATDINGGWMNEEDRGVIAKDSAVSSPIDEGSALVTVVQLSIVVRACGGREGRK